MTDRLQGAPPITESTRFPGRGKPATRHRTVFYRAGILDEDDVVFQATRDEEATRTFREYRIPKGQCADLGDPTVITVTVEPGDALNDLTNAPLREGWAREDVVSQVAEARRNGRSWADIGAVFGITRQAAWERFATAVDEVTDARPTDWEFRDLSDGGGAHHVGQVIVLNGKRARIHVNREEPIHVTTNGGALQSETLVSLVVLPEDVTYAEDGMPDTIGGVPVYTPTEDEHAWTPVTTDPVIVHPNGSHYPRATNAAGDGPETATEWIRVWVQARTVNFTYGGRP